MSISKSLALIPVVVSVMASASWAEPAADYGRPGWYAGVGAGLAWDFFQEAVDDATVGEIQLNESGTFNARGGYRLTSWFAIEAMYEGAYDLPIKVAGAEAATLSTHSFVPNFKFIVPTWRIQPYFTIGPGAQYGQFNGRGALAALDTDRWDFVLRLGFGIDGYISENWLLNLELAPSARFASFSNIPSESTDNVSLTFTLGAQYRF